MTPIDFGVITPAQIQSASPFNTVAEGMGYVWENFSRTTGVGATAATAGTIYYSLVPIMPGKTYTGVAVDVNVAGNSMTLAKVALHAVSDGAVLAVSASNHAGFNTNTGIISTSFGTALVGGTTPTAVYASILFVGGTPPTIVRGNNSLTANRLGSNAWPHGVRTSQTDITAILPASGGIPSFWMGLLGS